jgi:hypothetical protein
MSLLDDLKKKADQKQRVHADESRRHAALQAKRIEELTAILDRVEKWLKQFAQSLNEIGEETQLDYIIPDLGEMKGLSQGGYSVQRPRRDPVEPVQLLFSMFSDQSFTFALDSQAKAIKLMDEIKAAGLGVHSYRPAREPSGQTSYMITLQANIPVRVDFVPTNDLERITIRVKNFEFPGAIEHNVLPEKIDGAFLDDLGRYLLHQNKGFMRDTVSLELRQQLRERLEQDAEKKQKENSGAKIGSVLKNRFKKIFDRTPRLKLTYHAKDYELDPGNVPFLVGRAKECNLKVMAHHVSRHHFKIEYRDGNYILEDSSRNGTFIKPYDGRELLIKGERVGLKGKGFLCPGAPASEDQEHLIHFDVIAPGQG